MNAINNGLAGAVLFLSGLVGQCVGAHACEGFAEFSPNALAIGTMKVALKEKCAIFILSSVSGFEVLASVILKAPKYGRASLEGPISHTMVYENVRRIPDKDTFVIRTVVKLTTGEIKVMDVEVHVSPEK